MTDGQRRPAGRRPVVRLAGLAVALGGLALLGLVFLPVSADGVRATVEPFGVLAPVVFILVAAALALTFVPGPLLSAASGILFGAALGTVYSIASATLTAVLALLIARWTGAGAVAELSGPRALALADLARSHGFPVVVLQRLIPGVPDAPLSYAFGLAGLRVWQIALGTLLGSAPRAFAYTALGDASISRDGGLAAVAVAVGIAVSLVGIAVGWFLVRLGRKSARQTEPEPPRKA